MNQDFLDLLRALSDHEVDFMVVGAYAMAVHGSPRATGDIDIWIDCNPSNAAKAYAALIDFGAPLDDLTEQDLATPGIVFQMGQPPHRIDLLTRLSGVDFKEAIAETLPSRFGGFEVPVIGKRALIDNKRATGRPQDLLDADALESD